MHALCEETREITARPTRTRVILAHWLKLHLSKHRLCATLCLLAYIKVALRILAMEQDEPVDKFVEIVKIGRHFHWYPDVTLYYKSKDRKFKVEGGCKVDVNYKSDFVEIWIAMGHGRHLFKVTRFKRGAYQIENGYWISTPKRLQLSRWVRFSDEHGCAIMTEATSIQCIMYQFCYVSRSRSPRKF